jgi:UDP-N-acetylglucosamine 4,6-dehydratase
MKQVPACEYNPTEAIRTNVDGAINVAAAAIDAGVKRVIALSTDKAVNPANLYGATKACAERLFTHANVMAGALDTRFSCVRYGNVLGSRGSVLQVWRAQLAAGRKLTITSPLMTRFWLTLPQGVAYVLSALERMAGAEIFVPKLPSCSMVELAEMVAPDGGWERIPVRRGEKMHEILISADEADRVQAWPAEFIIKSEPLGEDQWRVPEGFTYRSDTNSDRLTATELAKILEGVA